MTREGDDLRQFIRWHTARSDRAFRDLGKIVERGIEAFDRQQRAFDRQQRAFDRQQQAFELVLRRLEDQEDERRALVNAVMLLIDEIRELGRHIRGLDPPAAPG